MSAELEGDAYDAGTEVADVSPAFEQEPLSDAWDFLVVGFAIGSLVAFAAVVACVEPWLRWLDHGAGTRRAESSRGVDASESRS
jgi:hypothetical protein